MNKITNCTATDSFYPSIIILIDSVQYEMPFDLFFTSRESEDCNIKISTLADN